MPEQLSKPELEALRTLPPQPCHAIGVFNFKRGTWFQTPDIAVSTRVGDYGGYAVTCTIRAELPPAPGREVSRPECGIYRHDSEPRVVVVQDLDRQPIGSMWGEVNAAFIKLLAASAR